MRVLHFYKTYYPDSIGGVEQAIRQICVGTGRLGVISTVLALTRQRKAVPRAFDGHMVQRVPLDIEIASNAISWRSIAALSRLAQEADVVHYHFPWPFMDLAHFLARVRKPAILTYHSDIVRQRHLLRLYQPLKRCFLRSVDAIVATSPNYVDSSPVLARHIEKTHVIPLGLDPTSYAAPTPDRLMYWRAQAGPKFFLFIGVLRYYKGLHLLLEAAAGTRYRIVIVGAGPVEQSLKEQAVQLGLETILFTGALPEEDKVALLKLCHCVVFPSHLRSEAFGLSLLEGAMFAKPMISCEIGTGTTFINIDGVTGLVVPPSDVPALREAMRTIWENPTLARQFGQRAAERFSALFTAERMASGYASLYREVVER